MRSSLSIDVQAPAGLVFELARHVERWPRLLPHYHAVDVLRRHEDGSVTARMLATRQLVSPIGYGIPVTWRARTRSDTDELGLSFRHQGGATNGMDVRWRIETVEAGCRVTIEHVFDPRLPGWARLIDNLFVRPIAGRTLTTFKAIAEASYAAQTARAAAAPEAGEAAASPWPRSAGPPSANTSA